MKSLFRAESQFNTGRFDSGEYAIGHLSDETAKLYARDFYLIGCVEESEILSDNDKSRYTAIVSKINGRACEVFFDLNLEEPEQNVKQYARRGQKQAEISNQRSR